MSDIPTITFRDPGNHDDGCAIVRAMPGHVILCLSLQSNGDTEVTIPIQEAMALIAALQRAVASAAE